MIKVAIRAGICLIAVAVGSAQVTTPPDYIASELKTYLKLDTQQARKINAIIADTVAFFQAKASDYLDLEDQIDALRQDATMEPQAIGLASANPIAAEITIKRQIDARLIETEKSVQELLTTDQKNLTAQLSVALSLQPLIFNALDAFILSEPEVPKNSISTNSRTSVFQLQSLFTNTLAATRKERLRRKP